MRIRTVGAVAGGAALAAAAVAAAYPALWRTRCLTWGANGGEVSGQMPGDDLMPNPDLQTTRAITVEAPPGAIWPWLVQMGSGRGGAYTYDWIENLFALDMHSASEILPQFQDLKVGDALPLGSNAPRDGARPACLHGRHGTRQPRHGTQDAVGHQAACRAPGRRSVRLRRSVT